MTSPEPVVIIFKFLDILKLTFLDRIVPILKI